MLPNNQDLEKSVLGCLMIDKSDYVTRLSEDDFYNPMHKLMYKSIQHLYEKRQQIDIITVSDLMKKRVENALQICAGYIDAVVTSENVGHYIRSLQDYTYRRQIITAADKVKLMAIGDEYETAVELKNDVMQKFDIPVRGEEKKKSKLGEIIVDVMMEIEERYNAKDEERLFTRFHDLDKLTAGLHPEEMTIIAARPGVGKTAFALQMMMNMAFKNNKCLFVSREMSKTQIGKRILSNLATVDGHKLRLCKSLKDEDFQSMARTIGIIDSLPIEINDSLASVQEIRALCRELKNQDKLDVLVVDYLQLCRSIKKCESRRHEVEDISRQFKEMSLEFKIPVVVLSQLSRESTDKGEPELHHLRESGSLEQDADNVIFLHVPKDTDETQDSFDIKVIVGKQRNGPTGYIWLRYFRRTFKLCNVR
jgi:replicative DNA helicase